MNTLSKMLLVGFFSMAMVACAPGAVYDPGEFGSYVEKFEAEGALRGVEFQERNLVVRFGELPNARARGMCEIGEGMTPTVTISEEAWNNSTEVEREQLMFHELGHCMLLRGHQSGMDDHGHPVSLMNPYKIQETVYLTKQAELLDELFKAR